MTKALFLDRDGVINKEIARDGGFFSPRFYTDFQLLPEVKEALEIAKKAGLVTIVITNQPDISRGLMELNELEKMHKEMMEKLPIDDLFVCVHSDEDECNCRKPKIGALLQAAKKWNIDLKNSYFVGDSYKDIEAGKNAQCTTFLIQKIYNVDVKGYDFLATDLLSAVQKIVELTKERGDF
jgi:D-glycero-D-manno-heptose 1,7-bisphosphate phosphatase